MKRVLALIAVLSFVLPIGVARADSDLTVGDVRFHQSGGFLTLANSHVGRTWTQVSIPAVAGSPLQTVRTTDLYDSTDHHYGGAASWHLTLDGASITSDEMPLRSVDTEALPNGIEVRLRWDLNPQPGTPLTLGVTQTITLYDHASVFEVKDAVTNFTPTVHRVTDFWLDAVAAANAPGAEVQRYVGGTDWRDDFRSVTAETGAFDDEGEVARFGGDHGFFFVTERRGGAASRVGFDGTTAWAGAEYARDVIDLGPILPSDYSVPNPYGYNRVENPAYPAPVNGRLVAPNSTQQLGTVATGLYDGGAQQAAAAYVDYLVRFRQPAYHHDVALNSFHPWSHGSDFNGTTMSAQADTIAALGGDEIILDDQWQGGPGGESGDWQWDATRFPDADHNGIPDVVDHIHALGLKLGLWMSPAEFNAASQTFFEHPSWACTPVGTATSQIPSDAGLGVWDFNNPDLRAYLTGVIGRLVRDDKVAEFKFDFQTWVDCPPYDYNDYEAAFASWIDDLEVRFPQVSFEFDETNDQRMYAFESVARGASWFDNFHTHLAPDGAHVSSPSQALHDIWMAAPWIPPATLGIGVYNDGANGQYPVDFQLAAACLTHWTFWYDIAGFKPGGGMKPAQVDTTKWWIDWYHRHRSDLGGLVYRLSNSDPYDMKSPAVFEPWSGDHGYLFAFRQAGDAPAVTLQGVDPARTYTLTNVRDGSVIDYTPGMTLPLNAANSAAVYEITAV